MTREEAIDRLKEARAGHKEFLSVETLNMAIKALEQEPCEDAISRRRVLDLIEHYNSDGLGSVFYGYEQGVKFADAVNKLPPVNPQPKTGHWIKSRDCYDNNHFTCPFCGHDIATKADTWDDNYCSNCGAKMVKPQERSDEE